MTTKDKIVIRILLLIAKLLCRDEWIKDIQSLETHIHVETWKEAA